MRKYCTLTIFLLTGSLLIFAASIFYYQTIRLSGDHIYVVERGQSLQKIALGLQQQGVIQHPYAFIALARISGHSGDLQSGEYFFPKNSTLASVLAKMVAGEVMMHSLRIGEGWTFAQIAAQIQANSAIRKTLDWSQPQTILQQLSLSQAQPEGLFYPETYSFPRGYTDRAFLTHAYQEMQRLLQLWWPDRAPNLPYKNVYQALIAASIIEKETALPAERGQIAGVIVRRLQQHMLLQVDPTVVYGLGGDYSKPLSLADLTKDTPYNTYLHAGLPPTPIGIPSTAAIHAALHPTPGRSLYFVARGDGRHTFSDTLAAHNQAVQAYRDQNKK